MEIKEMQKQGWSEDKIVNYLIHSSKIKKLPISSIRFIDNYITKLEDKKGTPEDIKLSNLSMETNIVYPYKNRLLKIALFYDINGILNWVMNESDNKPMKFITPNDIRLTINKSSDMKVNNVSSNMAYIPKLDLYVNYRLFYKEA